MPTFLPMLVILSAAGLAILFILYRIYETRVEEPKKLEDEISEALDGVKVWIVDALRDRPHPTHANVEMALAWIERAQPERAILTNLHVDLDYNALLARLPPGVEPAYDGMRFELEL